MWVRWRCYLLEGGGIDESVFIRQIHANFRRQHTRPSPNPHKKPHLTSPPRSSPPPYLSPPLTSPSHSEKKKKMAGGALKYRHLNRSSSHRQALLRNLVTSLIQHESIATTWPKAKEAQRLAEKLITLGKKNTEASRKKAHAIFYVSFFLFFWGGGRGGCLFLDGEKAGGFFV